MRRAVPTQLHDVIVEMFRARPERARELLVACADVEVGHGLCEGASIYLSQSLPSEYRADAVTVREFPRAIQRILEAFVKTKYQYRSEFAVRHRSEAIQDALIELVRSKVGSIEPYLQDRIYATDEEQALKLIVAVGAATADEMLAILERDLPSAVLPPP